MPIPPSSLPPHTPPRAPSNSLPHTPAVIPSPPLSPKCRSIPPITHFKRLNSQDIMPSTLSTLWGHLFPFQEAVRRRKVEWGVSNWSKMGIWKRRNRYGDPCLWKNSRGASFFQNWDIRTPRVFGLRSAYGGLVGVARGG